MRIAVFTFQRYHICRGRVPTTRVKPVPQIFETPEELDRNNTESHSPSITSHKHLYSINSVANHPGWHELAQVPLLTRSASFLIYKACINSRAMVSISLATCEYRVPFHESKTQQKPLTTSLLTNVHYVHEHHKFSDCLHTP